MDDNEETVIEKICSEEENRVELEEDEENAAKKGFPQLKEAGGFELLTCRANSRDLSVIPCSMAAKDLKKLIGGGQSKIYIRPIQKNLSVKSIVKENTSLLKEKCLKCGEQILLRKLRQHLRHCSHDNNLVFYDESNFTEDSADESIFDQSPFNQLNQSESPALQTQHPTEIQETNSITNTTELLEITSVLPSIISPQETNQSTHKNVDELINDAVQYCIEKNLSQNPVEVLREVQKVVVKGRPLDITDESECPEGETSFIIVNRSNLLGSAFDELAEITDKRLTLEVQFYKEVYIAIYLNKNVKTKNINFSIFLDVSMYLYIMITSYY